MIIFGGIREERTVIFIAHCGNEVGNVALLHAGVLACVDAIVSIPSPKPKKRTMHCKQ